MKTLVISFVSRPKSSAKAQAQLRRCPESIEVSSESSFLTGSPFTSLHWASECYLFMKRPTQENEKDILKVSSRKLESNISEHIC